MSTVTFSLREIAAQWRADRRIYPIYASIVRQFELGIGPCCHLESPIDRNDPEILEMIAAWFDDVDARSHAGHLRQALQTAKVAREDNLRALLSRFLDKEKKTAADRDKVDFLLVQYFAQCAPHSMHNHDLELDDIAQVLEPVLGEMVPHQPRWLEVLDGELARLKECKTLHELLEKGILAHVRRLKEEAGEMYFGSGAMLALTRFNFVARHAFFRLLHADLGTVRQALHELEKRGIKHLDCRAAGLSDKEPLEVLAAICHNWKTPFRAPYAAGQPFERMMKIARILQQEAAKPAPAPPPAIKEPPRAHKPEPPTVQEAANPAAANAPSAVRIPAPVVEEKPACSAETAPKATLDVQSCLEHIAEQLIGTVQPTPTSVATIHYREAKVLLSSWEVAAFTKGGNDAADALQRAVAGRTLLLEVVERKKNRLPAADLPEVIKLAHAEGALLQESIAKAKEHKDIDAAVNLAASCKRMLGADRRSREAEPLGRVTWKTFLSSRMTPISPAV